LAAQQQFEATKLRLAKEDADRKKKDINISPPATVPTIISSLPTHTIISSPPVTVTNLPVIVPATVLNLPAIVSTPISTTPPLATAPSSSTSSAASKVTTQPQTSNNVSSPALARYMECKKKLEQLQAQIKPNDETKQLKMKINRAVQQISATKAQVVAKADELSQIIQSAYGKPNLLAFCLDCLAEKLVGRGDSQIHVQQASAFPVGLVAAYLCAKNPTLTDILLAHFHKACIYTIPMYAPKPSSQSDIDFMKSIGYKEDADKPSGLESQDSYYERMAGFISLYGAFIQSNTVGHPHPLENAWIWLARFCNLRPPKAISPTILLAFLQVCGYELSRAYKKQFFKLLRLIMDEYLPKVPKKKIMNLQLLDYNYIYKMLLKVMYLIHQGE